MYTAAIIGVMAGQFDKPVSGQVETSIYSLVDIRWAELATAYSSKGFWRCATQGSRVPKLVDVWFCWWAWVS